METGRAPGQRTANRDRAVIGSNKAKDANRCGPDYFFVSTNVSNGSAVPVGQISQRTLGRPRPHGRRQGQHCPHERSSGQRHRRCLDDSSVHMAVNCGRDHQRPESLLKSRTVSGNGPVTMSVSFLIAMHEFEWLLSQAMAGRYGHRHADGQR